MKACGVVNASTFLDWLRGLEYVVAHDVAQRFLSVCFNGRRVRFGLKVDASPSARGLMHVRLEVN